MRGFLFVLVMWKWVLLVVMKWCCYGLLSRMYVVLMVVMCLWCYMWVVCCVVVYGCGVLVRVRFDVFECGYCFFGGV